MRIANNLRDTKHILDENFLLLWLSSMQCPAPRMRKWTEPNQKTFIPWLEIGLGVFIAIIIALVLLGAPPDITPRASTVANVSPAPKPRALTQTLPDAGQNTAAIAQRLALAAQPPGPSVASATTHPTQIHEASALKTGASGSVSIPAPDAKVKINGVTHELTANSLGSYPRYTVEAKSTIPIALELDPRESVSVQALDGGALNSKYTNISEAANDQGQLDLDFTVSEAPGSYRIVVMRSGTRSIFDFWVGPDLQPRVSSLNN